MRARLNAIFLATLAIAIALAIALPSVAGADVIPLDECSKKQEGEPCTTETKRDGACGKRSHTAPTPPPLDSSMPPSPPVTRTYVGCVEGATPTVKAKRCSIGHAANFAAFDAFDASLFAIAAALLVRRRLTKA